MTRTLVAALLFLAAATHGARAQIDALYEALGLPEVVDVMVAEGRQHGEALEEEMFPDRGGPAWDAYVAGIYDPDEMGAELRRGFAAAMAGVDTGPLMDFFGSERGRRIVGLEISAREALLDDELEAAASDRVARMRRQGDARYAMLRTFVEANDLIESNVAGSMTSNYAFYRGLVDGGAFDGEVSEEQVLADVWGQEDQIRGETTDWIYAYLGLAFGPLSDADIEAYTRLSQTEEGQALNHALFGAFDPLFARISHELGLGAARFMTSDDA